MKVFELTSPVLLTTLLLVTGVACTPELDISPSDYQSKLTIECILRPDSLPKLYLTRSQSYLGSNVDDLRDFVSDAIVIISDGTVDDVLSPFSQFDYYNCKMRYFYKGNYITETGKGYTLTVIDNSTTYTATTSTKITEPVINSVTFVDAFYDIYGEHEGVVVNYTDTPGERNFYRYQVFRPINVSKEGAEQCAVGRYMAEELGRSIYDDTSGDGKINEIIIEPAIKHQEGDTAIVVLLALDQTSAEFYAMLDKQKLAEKNPFIEPIIIQSKINGAIGVFGAVNISKPFVTILPDF